MFSVIQKKKFLTSYFVLPSDVHMCNILTVSNNILKRANVFDMGETQNTTGKCCRLLSCCETYCCEGVSSFSFYFKSIIREKKIIKLRDTFPFLDYEKAFDEVSYLTFYKAEILLIHYFQQL